MKTAMFSICSRRQHTSSQPGVVRWSHGLPAYRPQSFQEALSSKRCQSRINSSPGHKSKPRLKIFFGGTRSRVLSSGSHRRGSRWKWKSALSASAQVTAVYSASASVHSVCAGYSSIAITSKTASFATCKFPARFAAGNIPIVSRRMAPALVLSKTSLIMSCRSAHSAICWEAGSSVVNLGKCSITGIASQPKQWLQENKSGWQ
jgi:hypothetical protein